MKIHRFSGMANDYSSSVFQNVEVTESVGWLKTRAAAFLALLTEAYPEMKITDVAAWAMANGIPDWEFSIDTSDTQLIPVSGNIIYFLDDFPLPSNWNQLFTDWKNGYDIGKIPAEIIQPAVESVIIPSQPAPQEPTTTYQEPVTVQTAAVSQETAAATATAAQNTPTYQTEVTTQPETFFTQPAVYTTEPTTAPPEKMDDKTLLIIGGIVAAIVVAYFLKGKKKKKR